MSGPIGVPPLRVRTLRQGGKQLSSGKSSPMTPRIPKNSSGRSRTSSVNSKLKEEYYKRNMYLAFINNALQEKLRSEGTAFEELVGQFTISANSRTPSQVAQLHSWVLALSHVVSQLERTHAPLVDAILSLPWTTMDATFVKSYIEFVGMLVSARPEYLSLVLVSTVRGFTYQSGLCALDSGVPDSSTQPLTRRLVYDRLHKLLEHILSLIPTLSSTLEPILIRYFPHKRQNKVTQVTFIKNLLRISDYCLELSGRILAIIVDRALQIDVEIQGELEDIENNQEPEMFPLDPFDLVVGPDAEDSDSDSDDDVVADNLSDLSSDVDIGDECPPNVVDPVANLAHVQDMVAKLDSILKLVFDHFQRTNEAVINPSTTSEEPVSATVEKARDVRRTQFLTLLSIFDRTIIRTFKSRYTQFLVFWYSSLDPEFTDLFQGLLMSKALFETEQPAVTRVVAASYIASFVSRAQFVDKSSTQRVVALLCEFLSRYLEIYTALSQSGSNVSVPPGVVQQSIFYAVTQAVFLIYCFRWRDLLLDNNEEELDEIRGPQRKQWIPELDVVQRVVTSDLNPLKICSQNVVMQFARVAQSTGFIYCYTAMENNRRSELNLNSSQELKRPPATPVTRREITSTAADLNTFFPFDPYRLPLSSPYIENVYREWASVAIEVDDEDDSDEATDGEEQIDLSDDGLDGVLSSMKRHRRGSESDAAVLGESFGGMSISPVRSVGLAAD